MFRKGTRVVIVDEEDAREWLADVRTGQKGTVEKLDGDAIEVRIDGSTAPRPWIIPASSVERIRKSKVKG